MENTGMDINEKNNTQSGNEGNCPPCGLFSLPPKQYALLSSILGIQFVDKLDLDQQNSLGNFFVSLGSSLLAAAAQGQLIANCSAK